MNPDNVKKRVLIIEDEPDIMELVMVTLGSENYKLLQAMDGLDGLEKGKKEHPDLILLDIMLPKKNGYDICRELKGSPDTADIPIIMLTAFGQKREIEEGYKVKADDYIVKPFEPVKLRERVKKILKTDKPTS